MASNMVNHYDGEDLDDIGYLQSPNVKPDIGMSVPKMPAKLVPSGGQFSPGGLNGLGSKLKAQGGGMGKKVFSMMDLSAAAEESDQDMEPAAAMPGHYEVEGNENDDEFLETQMQAMLEHTVGKPPGMKRVSSERQMMGPSSLTSSPVAGLRPLRAQSQVNLLVVFDMDHTMVGDLVSLSDRDNIETNVPWTYWPEGHPQGLGPDFILPYLARGMMRPGMINLLVWLREIGATVVVYTHSEERWATKVCEAMEKMAGWNFIARLFSRSDCRDGHPEFTARKNLQFVINECHKHCGTTWANMENTIMFDDDGNALNAEEQPRLIKVASYDYWEDCIWNEVVNETMMARNHEDLADMVRRSVVEWSIAPPSYSKREVMDQEDLKKDARWAIQRKQKHQILVSYNKVARLDRVMLDIRTSMQHNLHDLEKLPEKIRDLLGKSNQPASRRQR